MKAYAAGDMRAFEDALLRPGGTDFQNAVWAALRRIPAGTTSTYRRYCGRRGQGPAQPVRSAPRIISTRSQSAIPCHRVVGSNGSLTGYAAGLESKRLLLEHELRWSGSLEATGSGFRNGKIEATLALPFAEDVAHSRVLRATEPATAGTRQREEKKQRGTETIVSENVINV